MNLFPNLALLKEAAENNFSQSEENSQAVSQINKLATKKKAKNIVVSNAEEESPKESDPSETDNAPSKTLTLTKTHSEHNNSLVP